MNDVAPGQILRCSYGRDDEHPWFYLVLRLAEGNGWTPLRLSDTDGGPSGSTGEEDDFGLSVWSAL